MTPSEKLAKVKDLLNPPDKEIPGIGTVADHAGDNLEGVIQSLKEIYVQPDDPIFTTLRKIQDQIYEILDIINEPEVNPGDRFPHITHHEEHQHDDSDGW